MSSMAMTCRDINAVSICNTARNRFLEILRMLFAGVGTKVIVPRVITTLVKNVYFTISDDLMRVLCAEFKRIISISDQSSHIKRSVNSIYNMLIIRKIGTNDTDKYISTYLEASVNKVFRVDFLNDNCNAHDHEQLLYFAIKCRAKQLVICIANRMNDSRFYLPLYKYRYECKYRAQLSKIVDPRSLLNNSDICWYILNVEEQLLRDKRPQLSISAAFNTRDKKRKFFVEFSKLLNDEDEISRRAITCITAE